MKRTALAFLACTLFVLSTSSQTKAPAWKVELGEPVELYEFLQEGKYLFFNSGPYAWLYNATSGEKVWSAEVKDYEKKGVHTLIGEKYVVGTDNALQCYDALTGKQLWSQEYKDIDQDEFRSYEFIDNTAVFWFETAHLAIDLTNGTEIWRTKIDFKSSLVDLGTYNYAILHQQKKMLVMEDGDRISLFDVTNGKKVASFEDMEANEDLIKEKNKWQWRSADRQYIVVALDDGAAVIDAANNKLLVKKEFKIDGDYDVFFKTENGCAVFGKEKIIHFDFGTGATLEIPFPIGDMRTVQPYKVGEQDILIVSAEDQMSAVDLRAGKILWKSKEEDPKFEGFAHRYIKQDGENFILAYNKGNLSSGGSWLYAMSINALTGSVNYQTPITISEVVLTNIARVAANIAGSIISFLKKGDEGEQLKKSFGFDNLGFNYEVEERDGNLLFTVMNKTAMKNPDTKDNPGEGFVLVNASTGAVVYKDYFEILYNSSWGAAGQGVAAFTPKPLIDGNVAYVCGNKRVIAFDLVAGKRLWTVEKELKDGYPTDIALYDGVVYLKFGKDPVTPSLDKTSVKVNSPWENDPHGFCAIDPASGKLLWRLETKEDMGRFLPQFSLKNYYNKATSQLYFSDEEKIYALGLRRDGGKYDWEFGLDKNKVGEIPLKKVYAVNETWIGTVPRTQTVSTGGGWSYSYTTGGADVEGQASFLEDATGADVAGTYTSWGNIWGVTAKRCLRVLFDEKSLLVFGTEGIGMIDVSSGKAQWVTEWDYDNEAVQYIPKAMRGKVVYCVDRKLTSIELASGKQVWQVKEAKKPRFFSSPDRTFLFSIDEEVISGYQVK